MSGEARIEEAIPGVLDAFAADADIRVVVLAGAGDQAFVSGADISQFESQRSGAEAVQRYEEIAEGAQARLQDFDKPTMAMIRGYCLGAGVNIANVCDLRIAATDAREMLITGWQYTAVQAREMGLVHHVAAVPELESFTRKLCGDIAANAPLTMRTAKRIIREILKSDYDAALCRSWVKECFESKDYAEGRKAFMEKRKPTFTGG